MFRVIVYKCSRASSSSILLSTKANLLPIVKMRVFSSGSRMTAFLAFQFLISPLLLAQATQVVEHPIKRVQRSAPDSIVPTNIYNEQWIYTIESEHRNIHQIASVTNLHTQLQSETHHKRLSSKLTPDLPTSGSTQTAPRHLRLLINKGSARAFLALILEPLVLLKDLLALAHWVTGRAKR